MTNKFSIKIKDFFQNTAKKLLELHVIKAVDYAENFLKGEGKGQEKKKIAIDYVFNLIKFPIWLLPLESKLKDILSGLIDELIEKAVEKLKGKINEKRAETIR